MEDSRQRNSPDSSTNEDNKPNMTNNNHISGGATSQAEIATRASSKNLTLGYKCPKGCKTIFVDESTFAGHLLSEHNVKLVVTGPSTDNQQLADCSQTNTTPSPLSSLSSPSSTPPTMTSSSVPASNAITKCPVCRLQVDDLPFHFATAHSTTNKSPSSHDRVGTQNNNNVLSAQSNYIQVNGIQSSNGEKPWSRSYTSNPPNLVTNDAIKSEVLTYEEMESGIDSDTRPPKPESPIKITNSATSSSVRHITPSARMLPIYLPSQPLPPSQLAKEDANQRDGKHATRLKNQESERNVGKLPMTIIPTVIGNHNQIPTQITINEKINTNEASYDTGDRNGSHAYNGMVGQPLSVKVEEGGAMNLSIKDSPRSEGVKSNGVHATSIPLPLLDARGVKSGTNNTLRVISGLPRMLNTDSNVSSASMSDHDSEGGHDHVTNGANGMAEQDYDFGISSEANDKKRRRKQTSVPPDSKDQRYWARRIKNNEAAKRSRDMRIQREKVIFDENSRLENAVKDLKADQEKLTTENKELKLKMSFILEENARLQDIIRNIQAQQQEQQQMDEEMDAGHNSRINGQTTVTTNGMHYK